jgi:uncharacterized protein YjbI with pentapeptide repeats
MSRYRTLDDAYLSDANMSRYRTLDDAYLSDANLSRYRTLDDAYLSDANMSRYHTLDDAYLSDANMSRYRTPDDAYLSDVNMSRYRTPDDAYLLDNVDTNKISKSVYLLYLYLSSPRFLVGYSSYSIFSFMSMLCSSLFVLLYFCFGHSCKIFGPPKAGII